MICPNCSSQLKSAVRESQEILHCSNCGGTFFQPNGINRITEQTAQELAADRQTEEISGQQKLCPKDKGPLKIIDDRHAVPQSALLLRCPKCEGIFAYPEDLLRFKAAQQAKIQFYKLWEKPLPSLKSVMVFSMLVVLGLGLFSAGFRLNSPVINRSNAQDLLGKVFFSRSGRYLSVSFRTAVPTKSQIVFLSTNNQQQVTRNLNSGFVLLHFATFDDIDPQLYPNYQVILEEENGKTTATSPAPIEVSQ